MLDLILVYTLSAPIPAMLWLAAFVERKRLHRDIIQEEIHYRTQRGRNWKSRILNSRRK